MSKRIVHCATAHRVGDPRVFWKECRTLAEAGYDVVYVVPHDRDEVLHGVQIRSVPVPGSGRERLTKTVRSVYQRALDEGPDAVIHLHDSDLLLAGLRLKRRGRRVVYDSHEDTPKQMRYQHWIPRPLRPVAGFAAALLERWAGRAFDGIIAAEPENARRFPPGKTALVHNFPIVDELVDPSAPPYQERGPTAIYIGALTRVRGLMEMVEATEILRKDLEVELVLGGPFHPRSLESEIAGRDGVTLPGYLSRPQVAEWLGRARVGLVLFHPFQKHIECYPTKLFEYMAAGIPVIASNFPVWREIIEDAGCGIAVDPLDSVAIAEAVRSILVDPVNAERMGARGRAAVLSRYDWRGEGRALLDFYRRLIGEPQS
jgi:glycosyltransferase involved in cell wall biosynthesis